MTLNRTFIIQIVNYNISLQLEFALAFPRSIARETSRHRSKTRTRSKTHDEKFLNAAIPDVSHMPRTGKVGARKRKRAARTRRALQMNASRARELHFCVLAARVCEVCRFCEARRGHRFCARKSSYAQQKKTFPTL